RGERAGQLRPGAERSRPGVEVGGEGGRAPQAGAPRGEQRFAAAPAQQLLGVGLEAGGHVGVDGRQRLGEGEQRVRARLRHRRLVDQQGARGGERLGGEDARQGGRVERGVVAAAAGGGDLLEAHEVGGLADGDGGGGDAARQGVARHARQVAGGGGLPAEGRGAVVELAVGEDDDVLDRRLGGV